MWTSVMADPIHGYDPALVASLGVGSVRFLPRWGQDYTAFTQGLAALGVGPFAVTTPESFTPHEIEAENYGEGFRRMAAQYPEVWAWQVDNEPDNLAGAGRGSTPMPPRAVAQRIAQARVAIPDRKIIAPAMATGLHGVRYLAALASLGALRHCDGVALNIYGTDPRDFPTLIGAYQQFRRPVYVTEIGIPHGYLDSEHDRAVYFSEAFEMLALLGLQLVSAFCFADSMVAEHGLLDVNLEPYEAWAAVAGAAAALEG